MCGKRPMLYPPIIQTRSIGDTMKGWLKIKEAAEYASVHRDTIKTWMADGLDYVQISKGFVRIRPEAIDTYLERWRVGVDESRTLAEKIVAGM